MYHAPQVGEGLQGGQDGGVHERERRGRHKRVPSKRGQWQQMKETLWRRHAVITGSEHNYIPMKGTAKKTQFSQSLWNKLS